MISKLKTKYSSMPVQVRASLWFLICNFMQKGIAFISTPIFTRILTTEQYGEFNVFQSWMSIVSIIVTLRLCYGVFMQGLVKFEHDAKVYASSMQGLTLTLCTVWTVIYFLFRGFFNELLNLSILVGGAKGQQQVPPARRRDAHRAVRAARARSGARYPLGTAE